MSLDPNASILIVDDYKTMVKIVRHLLGQLGYKNVDEAANGAEAFEKLKAKKFDLVISDWNMEPMTGYELLQKVRAAGENVKTPFIMVTAESKPENIAAAKKAGVSNYLVKPFNQQSLKAKIDAVFAPAAAA
ncbi:MAG: response regulator [Beijerinckiaceae bacterium]